MKNKLWLMTLLLAGAMGQPIRADELSQLRADLISQCMGGREKCWKFQSLDQIKTLVIKSTTEDAGRRTYTIALQLQATATSARYLADAQVEYAKVGTSWKIRQVGLLSLAKME
jgi:hypothetical protein